MSPQARFSSADVRLREFRTEPRVRAPFDAFLDNADPQAEALISAPKRGNRCALCFLAQPYGCVGSVKGAEGAITVPQARHSR
jgi:hypothetical protein